MFMRSAGIGDLQSVRDLLVDTWHATYGSLYGRERVTAITDDWHSIASLQARLDKPRAEFIVADDGQRLAGMAFAASGAEERLVWLRQLYVLLALQGGGIGKSLLAEIEESFIEAETLRVEVQ